MGIVAVTMENDRRSEDRREEPSPATILENHGKESINRIEKIDRWVKHVTYLMLVLIAITLAIVVVMAIAFSYLVGQIDSSRYETAVKSCQANRTSTHDGLAALMTSLSKTDAQKAQSQMLADTYFPNSLEACKTYAKDLGLEP